MDTVVIDYGSHTIRAGKIENFPSDNDKFPQIVVPSVALDTSSQPAQPKSAPVAQTNACTASTQQDTMTTNSELQLEQQQNHGPNSITEDIRLQNGAGESSQQRQQQANVVPRSVLEDQARFSQLLSNILYNQLKWDKTRPGCMVMTMPVLTPRKQLLDLARIAFEQLNVEAWQVTSQPVAALYAGNKTTGTVVDLGHASSDVSYVVDGQLCPQGATSIPLGGAHFTQSLQRQYQTLCPHQQFTIDSAQSLKHRSTQTAPTADAYTSALATHPPGPAEQPPDDQKDTYSLPDGQTITVPPALQLIHEAYFTPGILDATCLPDAHALPSVPAAVVSGVDAQPDVATRHSLLKNIMICGGCSLVPGLRDRLLMEIEARTKESLHVEYVICPDYMPDSTFYQFASWMGGAIFAKILGQYNSFITRSEYQESGPSIVLRKGWI